MDFDNTTDLSPIGEIGRVVFLFHRFGVAVSWRLKTQVLSFCDDMGAVSNGPEHVAKKRDGYEESRWFLEVSSQLLHVTTVLAVPLTCFLEQIFEMKHTHTHTMETTPAN